MKKAGYLGDRLVNENIITQEQLDKALEIQRERSQKGGKIHLGKIITDLGYCTDEDIARVLADKHEVPYIEIDKVEVSDEVLKLIPPQTANYYKVFPVKMESNKLVVAMMNPQDIMTIDDLRVITGKEIEPVLIKDSDLEILIRKVSNKASVEVEEYEFLKKSEPKKKQRKKEANVVLTEVSPHTLIQPQSSAVEIFNIIASLAIQEYSSEVHIEPFEYETRVRFRVDGILKERMHVPTESFESLASRIKVLADMDITDHHTPKVGHISVEYQEHVINIRTTTLPTYFGERITMRFLMLESELMDLNKLGLKEKDLVKVKELIHHPDGCILATGPTGSGKSTTIYAMLGELNSDNRNIITLEDLVERPIAGVNQIECNPKSGFTFSTGLSLVLRNHPDILMVGEIKDLESGTLTNDASLTGRLVLSTLASNNAAEALVRLLEIGVPSYLLESSLTAVLSQRLVRRLCDYCKIKYSVDNGELLKMLPGFPVDNEAGTTELYRASGCSICVNTGYTDLTGVFELMEVSKAIRLASKAKKSAPEIREIAIKEGMTTLREHCLDKIKSGLTTIEEFQRTFA